MCKVKVLCFGVSIDGFGAGPDQSLEHPLGVDGGNLMQWVFPTRYFQAMHGGNENAANEGTTGIDNEFAEKGFENIGSWILGRNMFGPIRGDWNGDEWKGWWGPCPPYKCSVFVLTHYARPPLVMEGGTTFYFITEGIERALQLAKEAANGKDVRIGGGVNTIRQYLSAGLIDELHIALSPTLLGKGENLFAGLNLNELGYTTTGFVASEAAIHLSIRKR